jgi:endonuclease/exonuclease/phosphatase family metal-dependent hydrolase
MRLRVLTWNLFHGRSVPPADDDLLEQFRAALHRWEWDVALLQEVPPWWPQELSSTPGIYARSVLTSRNSILPLRRALAIRYPNVVKSQGGGCNAILVRDATITEHRALRLCRVPERRWLHAVRIEPGGMGGGGVWVGNLHASGLDWSARGECRRAGATLLEWAAGEPSLLGGDFNILWPSVPGFAHAAGNYVDHVLVAGMDASSVAEVPDRGRLSDHQPVVASIHTSEDACDVGIRRAGGVPEHPPA